MKTLWQKIGLFLSLCLISMQALAGAYEPFMGHAVPVAQCPDYFSGYLFGIEYSFISGDYRTKTQNLIEPNSSVFQEDKHPSLEALNVYIGYGRMLHKNFYLGARVGGQYFTKSDVQVTNRANPDNIIVDVYDPRETGFADIMLGLVMSNRFMLYPFVGYSNSKYVFKSETITPDLTTKIRNQAKWGKGYRFGLGAKYAFYDFFMFDVNFVHNATNTVTMRPDFPTGPDQFLRRLKPISNSLNAGFEFYIK